MSIEKKMAESKFFLERINETIYNPSHKSEDISYYASAFSNAIRSVLQYIEKDVKSTNHQWYQNNVSNECILSFFKINRNLNVHHYPPSMSPIRCLVIGGVKPDNGLNKNKNLFSYIKSIFFKRNPEKTYETRIYLYDPINWQDVEQAPGICKNNCLPQNVTVPDCIKSKPVHSLCYECYQKVFTIVENGKKLGILT